jgi:hypothetical protein
MRDCLLALLLIGAVGCDGTIGAPAPDPEEEEGARSAMSFAIGATVKVCTESDSGVNFRTGPSTKYGSRDVLPEDTRGKVLAVSGAWYKLRLVDDGREGWSHGNYLCLDGSAPDPEPSPTPTPTPTPTPGPAGPWSCTGSYGTKKASNGTYYTTSFGCWRDSSGSHGDPGDNCIPACLSQARSSGLCSSGASGRSCEEKVAWYVADSGRFGCLKRLRITNPKNGKAVVAVALDAGPACWVEAKVKKEVLDLSVPVAKHLFGTASIAATEKQLVIVVEVSSSTPLGPL